MVRQRPILWTVVITLGAITSSWGRADPPTPKVVIDGYTVSSTLNSTATLPLGTTLILVCRLSGIPHGQQTTYTWTCPNTPCQQTGYVGRKINNNIIAINTTSMSDVGTYTCTVTAGGMNASQNFQLNVTGGAVVHSYGRLIFHERVITDKRQLQPPNNDTGDGRIECTTMNSNKARFDYFGYKLSNNTNTESYEVRNGSKALIIIRNDAFSNFKSNEERCAELYHYLLLSEGIRPDVNITNMSETSSTIAVNMWTTDNTTGRIIIGYHRLHLEHSMAGQYVNIGTGRTYTFSSLVPGAKYRITAWGLGGGSDKRRSHSSAVVEATTREQTPSPPRDLTITRVFQHGIELNWIPPRETNGDIQHYIIKYTTQDGTEKEINTTNNTNYYNLTELERGQTYNNITVVAVNSAGTSGGSEVLQHENSTSKGIGSLIPYIGGAGGGVMVLLLIVILVLLICTIGLARRRRQRRRRAHHTYTYYYGTTQDDTKHAHHTYEDPQEIEMDTHKTGGDKSEEEVKVHFLPGEQYENVIPLAVIERIQTGDSDNTITEPERQQESKIDDVNGDVSPNKLNHTSSVGTECLHHEQNGETDTSQPNPTNVEDLYSKVNKTSIMENEESDEK